MKNTKRIFALILAGLLSVSFASCKNTGTGDEGNKKGNGTGVEKNAEFLVPEGICEGETFSMYIALPSLKGSYVAPEETGDDFNDAVYQRNALVEEHTGAELEFVVTTRSSSGEDQREEASLIRTLIQSGDNTYDAFVHVQHSGMTTLIEEEMFVDWNIIPHVNINNPWWYSNVARDICFGDKVYCMTGDYNINSFAETECLIFNKTMCNELSLEYPYQMVFDGTWTHDKFVDYIKAATVDLNGDSTLDYNNDRFGFGGWGFEQILALFVGYGGETLTKDGNNLPVLNVGNELTYTIIDKMIEVFDCEGSFYENRNWGLDNRMFDEGRLMFNDGFLKDVIGTRNLENIDVGFVPYPKLNEEQKEYYSRTANISGLTYIPVTNGNLEKTGAVLESMAYFSNQTMMPTYFDVILTIKSTRDVESEDMIPIIRESSRFMDSVVDFNVMGIITAKNGNTLASTIAANQDAWNEQIENLIELYSNDAE